MHVDYINYTIATAVLQFVILLSEYGVAVDVRRKFAIERDSIQNENVKAANDNIWRGHPFPGIFMNHIGRAMGVLHSILIWIFVLVAYGDEKQPALDIHIATVALTSGIIIWYSANLDVFRLDNYVVYDAFIGDLQKPRQFKWVMEGIVFLAFFLVVSIGVIGNEQLEPFQCSHITTFDFALTIGSLSLAFYFLMAIIFDEFFRIKIIANTDLFTTGDLQSRMFELIYGMYVISLFVVHLFRFDSDATINIQETIEYLITLNLVVAALELCVLVFYALSQLWNSVKTESDSNFQRRKRRLLNSIKPTRWGQRQWSSVRTSEGGVELTSNSIGSDDESIELDQNPVSVDDD